MGELLVSLIPLALGVIMSPLAIMALVAVLLSTRARVNGIAYLIGWAIAVVIAMVIGSLLVGLIDGADTFDQPTWAAVVRLVLGLGLIIAAVFVYRKAGARKREMANASTPAEVVAAAPQLPGWLRAVATFTPVRSLLLGLAIFLFNPVDLSCVVLAVIDIRTAGINTTTMTVTLVVFAIIAVAPIAVPVIVTLVQGQKADPFLKGVRTWIAGHSTALNAGLLVLIGAMQTQKALSQLLGG